MKKVLTALTLITVFSAAAQTKSLLWKISGNGLSQPSYVFGTIHLTCDATLDKKVTDAMDKTSQLYLELDMDDPNLQSAMMSGMMMKESTMTSLASAEDIKIVDKVLMEKIGMPVVALNTVKPFMVSSMMLPMLMGCPIASVEQELMNISKNQKEEIFGLETVQEQLAVFDAIPYKIQMDELVKSVKDDFKSDKEELVKLSEIYKNQDIDAMVAMMNESENKISSQYQDQLLVDRNKNWIPKMESIAKSKATFFGVGAAHLGGKNGVLELLKKKGYKVEPVQ